MNSGWALDGPGLDSGFQRVKPRIIRVCKLPPGNLGTAIFGGQT